MTRLNLVLLLAVMASALYLVRTQYESRQLFVEFERAKAEARRIEVEYEALQIQQRAQATPLRVEKLAKDKLLMRTATPAITQYVRYQDQPRAPGNAMGAGDGAVTSSAARAAASVGVMSR